MSSSSATTFELSTDVRLAFVIFGFIIQASLVHSNEYCLSDFFNATCGEAEVVVMTTALHGRMRSGRCIRMEYDKERCQKDVLRYLDKICSGKRSCSFPVATLRESAQVCHSDLSTYLEASYRCVKVSSETCLSQFYRPSVDHSKDYLPSPVEGFLILPTKSSHHTGEPTHFPRVGSPSCPWNIRLDPRQKIKFVLYSFGADDEPDSKGYPSSSYIPTCSSSLVFEENSHITHEKLCRSSSSRKWNVFTSTWYSVAVYVRPNQLDSPGIFLLQYEAIGCPGLKSPSGATVSYEGQSATFRCNTTGDEWELTCEGAQWFGEMNNCSEAIQSDALSRDGLPLLSFAYLPYGLATAVTIGVLLGIVVGSVPLGLAYVFLKRKWQKTSKDLLQSDAYDMQSRKIDSEDPHADQSCPQLFFHNAQQPLVGPIECECYGPPHHHHHHQTFIPTHKNPPLEMMVPDGIPRSDFPDIGMRQILMHAPAKHYCDQTRVSEGLLDKTNKTSAPSLNDPKLTSIDAAVYFDVQLSPIASHSVGINRERHHPEF